MDQIERKSDERKNWCWPTRDHLRGVPAYVLYGVNSPYFRLLGLVNQIKVQYQNKK